MTDNKVSNSKDSKYKEVYERNQAKLAYLSDDNMIRTCKKML